jgi:hypothetical protein
MATRSVTPFTGSACDHHLPLIAVVSPEECRDQPPLSVIEGTRSLLNGLIPRAIALSADRVLTAALRWQLRYRLSDSGLPEQTCQPTTRTTKLVAALCIRRGDR